MMPYDSDEDEDEAIWEMAKHLESDFLTAYEAAESMPLKKVHIPIISTFAGPKTLSASTAGIVESITRAATSIAYTFAVVMMAMAFFGVTSTDATRGPTEGTTDGVAHDLIDQGKLLAARAVLALASTHPRLGTSLTARILPQVKLACGVAANILPRNPCGGSSTVLDARTQRTSTLPSNTATRASHPESHKAHMHPSGIDDRPGNHDIRGRHTPPRGVAARCDASGARAGGSSKIGGGSSRKSGIPILAASTTTTSSTSILSRPAIILQTPTRA